jgi:hypothetical protein
LRATRLGQAFVMFTAVYAFVTVSAVVLAQVTVGAYRFTR